MTEKAEIMDEKAMQRAITRISFEIVEKNKGISDLYIVGIKRRGVVLAKWIAQKITEVEGKNIEVGELDITRYRDDISDESSPVYGDSKIDFDVKDKKIVLVDDVLYTGRTVRAAIDALISLGRPKQIQLAVLVDRGHRELPIRPDYIGKNVPTSNDEAVKVLVKDYDLQNRVIICSQ